MKCWKRVEILDTHVTEVISGKGPQGSEGASHAHIYRKSLPGRGNSTCKGAKEEAPLTYFRIAGVLCGQSRLRGSLRVGEARPWRPCGYNKDFS